MAPASTDTDQGQQWNALDAVKEMRARANMSFAAGLASWTVLAPPPQVHLYHYNDFAHRDKHRAMSAANKEWQASAVQPRC